MHTEFWLGELRKRDHLKDLGIDGNLILKCSVMGRHGLDLSASGYGQVVGACECGNEPSGSITCREFLE